VSVSRGDVERIAQLAALEVDDESLPALTQQIGRILEYVSQLEAVQGGAEMPAISHAPGLRDDVVQRPDLAVPPGPLAPAFKDGLYLVPRLGGVGADAAPEDDE
jgi:aspartyl-tRNA(Asn)/glutamyl-tRNA(Gln) amidotransferase subunit C